MLPRAGLNMLASIVDVSHFRGFIGFMVRVAIYHRRSAGCTDWDPSESLRQEVENRGGIVVATYIDDDGSTVRTPECWLGKTLLANLDAIDQVAIGIGRRSGRAGTSSTCSGCLEPSGTMVVFPLPTPGANQHRQRHGIQTYWISPGHGSVPNSARRSKSGKHGQSRQVSTIGRPAIPHTASLVGIQRSLASGAGIRWTARRFAVSGGTVINIRKSMTTGAGVEAGFNSPQGGHQAMHILRIIILWCWRFQRFRKARRLHAVGCVVADRCARGARVDWCPFRLIATPTSIARANSTRAATMDHLDGTFVPPPRGARRW